MTQKTTIFQEGEYVEVDRASLEIPTEAPVFLRSSLFKTDIYSRMTDEELSAFDLGMETADTRTRLMWRDCLQVDVNSPLFPLLQARLTEAFGPDRAAQILSLEA